MKKYLPKNDQNFSTYTRVYTVLLCDKCIVNSHINLCNKGPFLLKFDKASLQPLVHLMLALSWLSWTGKGLQIGMETDQWFSTGAVFHRVLLSVPPNLKNVNCYAKTDVLYHFGLFFKHFFSKLLCRNSKGWETLRQIK